MLYTFRSMQPATDYSSWYAISPGAVNASTGTLFGPFVLRRSTPGDPTYETVDSINTRPPDPFSEGIYARQKIGQEKNVYHTQVAGSCIINRTRPASVELPFIHYRDTPNYATYRNNSIPRYYQCVSASGRIKRYGTYENGFTLNDTEGNEYHTSYWSSIKQNVWGSRDAMYYSQYCVRRSDGQSTRTVMSYILTKWPKDLSSERATAYYRRTVIFTDFDGTVSVSVTEDQPVTWFAVSSRTEVIDAQFLDLFEVRRKVASIIGNWYSVAFEELRTMSFYQCCKDAVSSVNSIDMNNFENSSQLRDLRSMMPPAKEVMQWKKHPAKAVASVHLWNKYALQTALRDGSTIVNNLADMLSSLKSITPKTIDRYGASSTSMNIMGQEVFVSQRAKVRLTPLCRTSIEEATHKASSLGFAPSFENAWDLVPYSFVVDWFLGVGNFLNDVDYGLFTRNRFDVSSVTTSAKFTTSIPLNYVMPLVNLGPISFTAYLRVARRNLPLQEFHFGSSEPTRHIFDGAALLIANW